MNAPAEVLTFTPEQVASAAEQAADPQAVATEAIARFKAGDAGAVYEEAVVEAFRAIRRKSEADYQRIAAGARGCKTTLNRLTKGESQSSIADNYHDMILAVARTHATFAHTAEGAGIALIEVEGHREVHALNSPGFDEWLRGQVYAAHEAGIPDQAMKTGLGTLAAMGKYDGPRIETHMRCAFHDGAYYLDLCNDTWQAVRIADDAWEVMDRPPVYFTRTKSMRPLRTPEGAGDVGLLWQHVNIPEDARALVLTWLLDAMRPNTAYPVLELCGEQGAAKSTTQRRLRALIDPNEAPLRSRPKDTEALYIAANNSHVVSFENVSSLTPEQQDALCILSTGGAYAARQLYTNGSEHVVSAHRPVVLNGIVALATAPDLLERVIAVELPTIAAKQRRDDQTLEAAWQRDYPSIFAGLLTLFSKALALLPSVRIPEKMQKRMLDMQQLGEAVAIALGGTSGDFSKRLNALHDDSLARGLESYGIAAAIQILADRPRPSRTTSGKKLPDVWSGTVLELLNAINDMPNLDRSNWPRSARHLTSQIKRIMPGLRSVGIKIEHKGKTRNGAVMEICRE
ncbi:MAG: hypothetical protein ACKO0Z_11730 [Betaproteobacteria bacterium]